MAALYTKEGLEQECGQAKASKVRISVPKTTLQMVCAYKSLGGIDEEPLQV